MKVQNTPVKTLANMSLSAFEAFQWDDVSTCGEHDQTYSHIEYVLVNRYVEKWTQMENCTNMYGLRLDAVGTVQSDLDRRKEKYKSDMSAMWRPCPNYLAFYHSYGRAKIRPSKARIKAKNIMD